jgi:hypothetical protein
MLPTKQWPIEDSSMHYIILVVMRVMLAALILLGVGFLVLMGLMSIIRELFADDHHHQQPQLSENDMRLPDSVTLQISAQPTREPTVRRGVVALPP